MSTTDIWCYVSTSGALVVVQSFDELVDPPARLFRLRRFPGSLPYILSHERGVLRIQPVQNAHNLYKALQETLSRNPSITILGYDLAEFSLVMT